MNEGLNSSYLCWVTKTKCIGDWWFLILALFVEASFYNSVYIVSDCYYPRTYNCSNLKPIGIKVSWGGGGGGGVVTLGNPP